jgi:hypothetical protein
VFHFKMQKFAGFFETSCASFFFIKLAIRVKICEPFEYYATVINTYYALLHCSFNVKIYV